MRRLLALVVVVAGCSAGTALPPTSVATSTTVVPATTLTTPAGDLRLVVEPDAGIGPIDDLVTAATSTIDLEVYELLDTGFEQLLATAATRGITVRVILDHNLEGSRNQAAFTYLAAHGVHVAWAPPGFAATHEKAIVVDRRVAAVMSLNLVSADYRDTRDFAVIDDAQPDVAGIEGVFDADFSGAPVTPDPGLVWSPGSQSALTGLIGGATHTLLVENEEMSDRPVVTALAEAAARGVDVTVVMTASSEWRAAFDTLAAAGVHVVTYRDSSSVLYIHAKAIVADGAAFVGSENFSAASLDRNRELGIITSDPAVVSGVSSVIRGDAAGGSPWVG